MPSGRSPGTSIPRSVAVPTDPPELGRSARVIAGGGMVSVFVALGRRGFLDRGRHFGGPQSGRGQCGPAEEGASSRVATRHLRGSLKSSNALVAEGVVTVDRHS